MPSIDGVHIHLIHEDMSRPLHFLLSAVFLAGALGLSGCVGTMYDETYTYHKNHFKPPQEIPKGEASAEAILGSLDKKPGGAGADASALLPAGDVPGLPPAGVPDAGGIPAPGAPAAPAAPPAAPPPN